MTSFDDLFTGVKLLMLIEQQLAGNKVNPEVFKDNVYAVTSIGGFNWDSTIEGDEVWNNRITDGKYDLGLCLCNIRSITEAEAKVFIAKPYFYNDITLPKSALKSIGITKYVSDKNLRPLIYYEQKGETVCDSLKFACDIVDNAKNDLHDALLKEFYTFAFDLACSLNYKEEIKNKFNELFKNGKDQNQLQGKEVYREYRESGSGIRLQSNKFGFASSNLEYRSRYQRTGTKLGYRGVYLSFESRHLC